MVMAAGKDGKSGTKVMTTGQLPRNVTAVFGGEDGLAWVPAVVVANRTLATNV
jgi:hypothetical protein